MAKRRHPARASRGSVPSPEPLSWYAVAIVAVAILPWFVTFAARTQLEAVDTVMAVVALSGLVGAAVLVAKGARLHLTRLTIAWGAFMGWSAVSMVASGRGWTGFMGEATALAGWAALGAVTLAAWSAGQVHKPVSRVIGAVAPWLVLFQCAFAIVQVFLGGIGVGTLPNSTYLGEAVLLVLPWVLVPSEKRQGRDLWIRVGIVLLAVAALGASGSRVAAVLALIWAVWTFSRQSGAPVAVRRWAGPAAILLVAAGGLLFARAEVLGSVGVGTLGGRPSMWRLAALAVGARPLLGWGPDGFVAGGASAMTPEQAEKGLKLVLRFGTTDPHNLLVFIAVSAGVVGLGLFLWTFAEMALRWRAHAKRGLLATPAVWALGLCLGVLLTAPASPHILPLLGVVAGVSVAPLARRAEPRAIDRSFALAVVGLLSVSGLLLGANALARLPFEESGPQVSPPKAAASLAASRLWSFDPHLAYLASLHSGYAVQSDRALASQQPDLAAIERAARLDRRNPFYALEWARTLDFYGADPSRVAEAFEETLRRYPGFPAARAEYGLFLAKQGRDDEARRELDIARLVDDGDPQVSAAIEAAEKALDQ